MFRTLFIWPIDNIGVIRVRKRMWNYTQTMAGYRLCQEITSCKDETFFLRIFDMLGTDCPDLSFFTIYSTVNGSLPFRQFRFRVSWQKGINFYFPLFRLDVPSIEDISGNAFLGTDLSSRKLFHFKNTQTTIQLFEVVAFLDILPKRPSHNAGFGDPALPHKSRLRFPE